MLQNPRAKSYPQPTLPINASSSLEVQDDVLPLNTKEAPTELDTWTVVSHWLDTIQTSEPPPEPASIADPAPWKRLYKDNWLAISKNLELRMKSRSEKLKAATDLNPGSVPADHCSTPILSKPVKQTPLGQIYAPSDKSLFPRLVDTSGSANEQEREKASSVEANTCQEKFEEHKREREQFGKADKVDKADETVQAMAKLQLEAAELEKTDGEVMAKGQLKAEEWKEVVRAKAKKLAADAMAAHKKEQERIKYVEGRAWDIHMNLLLCRPFDVDAVRREFSEEEVQDVKRIVRELGFAEKK